VVYPIMRGLAPLIVSIATALFIEPTRPAVFAGVAIVAVGIVLLGADGWRHGRAGIGPAVANAVVIAAYTILDGLGARTSGAPATYTAWILVGGGVGAVAWQLAVHGKPLFAMVVRRAPLGLAGGLMGFGAYGIVLWAMTVAPIGAVAAVRESSVLFATALGALALHERFGIWRWLAAGLVVAGLAVVKLGGAG
jgi:drug/metabolite transporter (DMT)-like permease